VGRQKLQVTLLSAPTCFHCHLRAVHANGTSSIDMDCAVPFRGKVSLVLVLHGVNVKPIPQPALTLNRLTLQGHTGLYAAPASQAMVPRLAPGCFICHYRSLFYAHMWLQHACNSATQGPSLLSVQAFALEVLNCGPQAVCC
jgi:hypothetical protein